MPMGFLPAPATTLGKGTWAFELHYWHSNYFLASPNVNWYLGQRTDRSRLTEQEIDRIMGFPEDSFLIEGELGVLNLTAQLGLSERLDVSLTVPYFVFTGGGLDGLVFDFHQTLGLPNNGREVIPQNQFLMIIDVGEGSNLTLRDPPTRGGFGDPMLIFRYAFPSWGAGWRFGLEGGAKFPLADPTKMLSSGGTDYGLQLALERIWRRTGLVINAAYVEAGRFRGAFDFDPAPGTSLNLSLLHRLSPRLIGAVQLLSADSAFHGITRSGLGDPQFLATVGLRWLRKRNWIAFAVTENFVNYDNSPDIGLHLSFGILSD